MPTPVPVDTILFMRQAIASSRHAWSLLSDDPEIMFNTAQVTATLAEHLTENDNFDDNVDDEQDEQTNKEALALLQESISIFDQCLARQKILLQEYQEMDHAAAEQADGPAPAPAPAPASETPTDMDVDDADSDGQLASVRAATTTQDLIDTAHALLSAMAAFISLDDTDSQTETIAKAGQELITAQLPVWLQAVGPAEQEARQRDQSRHGEFELAVAAKLFAAGSLSLDQYMAVLSSLGPPETAISQPDFDYICIQADERLQMADNIASYLVEQPARYQPGMTSTLWNLLSKSQELFTAASKLRPQSEDLMVSRADVEVLRFRLGVVSSIRQPSSQPTDQDIAVGISNSAGALLKNASKLYEAASNEYRRRGEAKAAGFYQGSVMLMTWAIACIEGRGQDCLRVQQQLEATGTRWARAMADLDNGLLPGVDRRSRPS